jgi:hypothetical protein
MASKSEPPVKKGVRFPFSTAVACWIDLLGYGSMIREGQFNPLDQKSKEAISRLRSFHQIVSSHSARPFPSLVINDGSVTYRDLSYRSRSVTFDFLCRCWSLFNEIQSSEVKSGYPGARMVIATGFRVRRRNMGVDVTSSHVASILERFHAGEMDADQAILEASSVEHYFDGVPQLQANFAFTKAYVAESDGKKGGLEGPNRFVDLALFRDPPPAWLKVGPHVLWENKNLGLKATFAPMLAIEVESHSSDGSVGIRDGLEIAQHLADDVDVLRALRDVQNS